MPFTTCSHPHTPHLHQMGVVELAPIKEDAISEQEVVLKTRLSKEKNEVEVMGLCRHSFVW